MSATDRFFPGPFAAAVGAAVFRFALTDTPRTAASIASVDGGDIDAVPCRTSASIAETGAGESLGPPPRTAASIVETEGGTTFPSRTASNMAEADGGDRSAAGGREPRTASSIRRTCGGPGGGATLILAA